jgi:hypothetical protein
MVSWTVAAESGSPELKTQTPRFFSHLRCAAQRAESDPIVQAFQLQFVAGRKLQLFPHRLWQNDTTQLVYRQLGKHFTIICWNLAPLNTIRQIASR